MIVKYSLHHYSLVRCGWPQMASLVQAGPLVKLPSQKQFSSDGEEVWPSVTIGQATLHIRHITLHTAYVFLANFVTGCMVTCWKKYCNHNYINRYHEQCALLGVTPIRTKSEKLVFYSLPLAMSNCEKAMLQYKINKYWLTLQNLLSDNCTVQRNSKGQYGFREKYLFCSSLLQIFNSLNHEIRNRCSFNTKLVTECENHKFPQNPKGR